MKQLMRITAVLVVVTALAGGVSLIWAPGPKNRPVRCPWPACTDACDPSGSPLVTCIEKDGTSFETTLACCCCNADAKHRSYIGPK